MIYIYESHLGGLYISNEELSLDETYCETCGDCDWLGCMADSWMDVAEYLRGKLDVFGLGGFDMEYCIDFFNQCCSALGGDNLDYLLNKDGGSYYGE